VGHQLRNGYWVKAKILGPEPEYLLAKMEGFTVKTERKKFWEMEGLTAAHFNVSARKPWTSLCHTLVPSAYSSTSLTAFKPRLSAPHSLLCPISLYEVSAVMTLTGPVRMTHGQSPCG